MAEEAHKDWALIKALGGPGKAAELLKLTGAGRVQRVSNWKTRGIPSLVKLQMLEEPALAEKLRSVLSGDEMPEAAVGGGA